MALALFNLKPLTELSKTAYLTSNDLQKATGQTFQGSSSGMVHERVTMNSHTLTTVILWPLHDPMSDIDNPVPKYCGAQWRCVL